MVFLGCSTHPSPKVLEQGAESMECHPDRSRISLWDSRSALHRAAPRRYPARHHPSKQQGGGGGWGWRAHGHGRRWCLGARRVPGGQGERDPSPAADGGMNQGAGGGKRGAARGGGAAQPDTGSRSRERCEVPKGSIAILISYESILTCHGQLGRLTPELQDLINGLSKSYL